MGTMPGVEASVNQMPTANRTVNFFLIESTFFLRFKLPDDFVIQGGGKRNPHPEIDPSAKPSSTGTLHLSLGGVPHSQPCVGRCACGRPQRLGLRAALTQAQNRTEQSNKNQ